MGIKTKTIMTKFVTKSVILLTFVGSILATKTQAQEKNLLKIMSTNIRYASPNDGINIWDHRKDWLCNSINFMDIDVLGAQEVIDRQLNDISNRLPKYKFVGIGRNGGKEGEYCPIFYKKEKYILLESNTFWLSKTPEKVNSKGWDAALPRIVTYVKLRDKQSGSVFYFFNTHFDHKGKMARLKSAELLTKKAKQIAGKHPYFITGDFNLTPSSQPYKILTTSNTDGYFYDTYMNTDQLYGPDYTFNGFKIEPDSNKERIDYIFYRGNITILKHHVLDGQRGSKFISDHFPIIVNAVIN
ncbi:Metal-dependent hydrolase, endonuclease/exonuclease/phosphatase family [Zhouia amylolytica]|uniref:Metal-dependent hydrolase, endonuclease/exonuclease/phosphatase family n=2 Tax=Zhouia amylolytica TaxID=376730 RepID=A0A1I6TF20_9FLAO|nr:Metal-dependent hydrolase, endonuclease/exonuclease/phosphatase family [Zhouia amylolytica]